MGKLGGLFGKDKKKEEEDEDEEEIDISKLMQGIGVENSDDSDSFSMGDGGTGSTSLGVGVSPDLREDVERNEEDIRELRVTVEKLENHFEDTTERLTNIESNIDQLLDVYEMVSAEFNPFLEKDEKTETKTGRRSRNESDIVGELDKKGDFSTLTTGMSRQPEQFVQPEQYRQPEQFGQQEQYRQPEQFGQQEQFGQPEQQYRQPEQQYRQPEQFGQQEQQYRQPEQFGQQEQFGQPEQQYRQPEQFGQPEQQYKQQEQFRQPEQQHATEMFNKSTKPERKGAISIEDIMDVIEVGNTYLLEDDGMVQSYRLFKKLLGNYENALCLTRKYPEHIKQQYGLIGTEFLWLSNSGENYSVSPSHLDSLSYKLENFISKGNGIIFFEGIEFLLSNNNPATVIRLIQSIQDQILLNGIVLLIVVEPETMDKRHMEMLHNELNPEILDFYQKEQMAYPTEDKSIMDSVEHLERELDMLQRGDLGTLNMPDVIHKMNEMIRYLEREESRLKRDIKDLKGDMMFKQSEPEKMPRRETSGRRTRYPYQDTSPEVNDLIVSLRDVIDEYKERLGMVDKEESIDDEQAEFISKEIVDSFRVMSKKHSKTGTTPDFDQFFEELKSKLLLLYELSSEEVDTAVEEEITTEDIPGEKEVIKKSSTPDSGINIGDGINIEGDLQLYGDKIVVKEGTCITGDITSVSSTVVVEQNSRVEGKIKGKGVVLGNDVIAGDIESLNDIIIGKRSSVNNLLSKGDVVLSLGVKIKGDMNYGGSLVFGEDELQLIESPKKESAEVK